MKNLDLECAKLGRRLAESGIDEKVFTKALGVLEEQGPYACFLYLQALEGAAGRRIAEEAKNFLALHLGGGVNTQRPLEFVHHLASDLDRLLFARDLLRQAFVYASYHAKTKLEKTV